MFKVALVLLLAHSAWGIATTLDDIALAAEDEYIANYAPGVWPTVCGGFNNEERDGCTFSANYWTTHNSKISTNPALAVYGSAWPVSPGSFLMGGSPFCFDRFRYLARNTGYSVWGGLTPMVDGETLMTETSDFVVQDYQTILRGVTNGFLTSPCARLASEYIAAVLNRCNQACSPAGHIFVMRRAADFVFSPACGGTLPASKFLTGTPTPHPISGMDWSEVYMYLRDYNNGPIQYTNNGTECAPKVGPGYCYTGPGVKPENVTCAEPIPECDATYPCEGGCTHTQGYWKNHRAAAQLGKKKQKQTVGWDDICPASFLESVKGNSTTPLELFPYFGDLTWGSVLDTSPKGDACIIAAKQVIAAQLNIHCQMACVTPEIASAIAVAEGIMAVECPGIGDVNSSKRELLAQAKYIEGYNTGWNGPGDCSDITIEAATAAPATAKEEEQEDTITGLVIGLVVFGVVSCCLIVGVVYYMGKDEQRYKGN